MYELEKSHFQQIEHLIDRPKCNNEFLCVIDGYNNGSIFVDDAIAPKTALVWSNGVQGFGVLGDVISENFTKTFPTFLDEHLIPYLKNRKIDTFEVNCINDSINESFLNLLAEKRPYSWEQYIYIYEKDSMKSYDDYHREKIFEVNHKLLSSGIDITLIKDTINQYWGSIDKYLSESKAIGYCIVQDNKVVSLCYTSFLSDEYNEIGIETLSEYRQKGYAEAAAYHTVKKLLSINETPYWDCTTTNIGSYKVAEKIGFTRKTAYKCFGLVL